MIEIEEVEVNFDSTYNSYYITLQTLINLDKDLISNFFQRNSLFLYLGKRDYLNNVNFTINYYVIGFLDISTHDIVDSESSGHEILSKLSNLLEYQSPSITYSQFRMIHFIADLDPIYRFHTRRTKAAYTYKLFTGYTYMYISFV